MEPRQKWRAFLLLEHDHEQRVESFMQSRLTNNPRHSGHPCSSARAAARP